MRVKIHRSNKRHAELKRSAEAAAATAAADASRSDLAISDSDLTDLDSHGETPSLVNTIRVAADDSKANLREKLKGEEFNLRKRKVAINSPLGSVKRLKQSWVSIEPIDRIYDQSTSVRTPTNSEITRAASPVCLDFEHKVHVAAALRQSHGFATVNPTKRTGQSICPSQILPSGLELSDSDEGPSMPGRTGLNSHMSDAIPLRNEFYHPPDAPGEGFASHKQYPPLQEAAQSHEITPKAAQRLPGHQKVLAEVTAEASSQPQPSDKFVPWSEISKRRAKKSKTALRPRMDNDGMGLLIAEDQSMTDISLRPLSGIRDLASQQDGFLASVDDNDNTKGRTLMRRTYFHIPATQSPKRATSTVPAPTSISSQRRVYQTPYADARSPLPTPQSAPPSADAVLGVANLHPTSIESLLVPSGSTMMNKEVSVPADIHLSARLITNHFADKFVKFTLPVINGPSENKWIKLTECLDAVTLHKTVVNRFKYALSGRIPSEVLFTFFNEGYGIDADESGQATWDDLMQIAIDRAPPNTCGIVATVRM
jgi:hypothetical protein